jgi:hypothetical protein
MAKPLTKTGGVSSPQPKKTTAGATYGQTLTVEKALKTAAKALKTAAKLLDDQDPEIRLRACHAVFQGFSSYIKGVEAVQVEQRITALETAHQEARQGGQYAN